MFNTLEKIALERNLRCCTWAVPIADTVTITYKDKATAVIMPCDPKDNVWLAGEGFTESLAFGMTMRRVTSATFDAYISNASLSTIHLHHMVAKKAAEEKRAIQALEAKCAALTKERDEANLKAKRFKRTKDEAYASFLVSRPNGSHLLADLNKKYLEYISRNSLTSWLRSFRDEEGHVLGNLKSQSGSLFIKVDPCTFDDKQTTFIIDDDVKASLNKALE